MPNPSFRLLGIFLAAFSLAACSRKSLDRVQQNWNRDRAKSLVEQAQPIFTAGDYEQNVRLLQEATKTDPGYALGWSRLCLGYQFNNEFDLAFDACRRAAEVGPSSETHNALGQLLLKRKQYKDAAEAFARISSQDRDSDTQIDLVTALLYSAQYEKAAPEAQKLVDMSANRKNLRLAAYEMLATADHQLGRSGQEAEALAQLRASGLYWGDVKYCEMTPGKAGDLLLVCLKQDDPSR
jgi:Tfp pilus assembly protein PilF